jgi:hypothetical protein
LNIYNINKQNNKNKTNSKVFLTKNKRNELIQKVLYKIKLINNDLNIKSGYSGKIIIKKDRNKLKEDFVKYQIRTQHNYLYFNFIQKSKSRVKSNI